MRQEICSSLVVGTLALGSLFAIAPIPLAAEASATKCVSPADIARLYLPLTRTAHRLASRDRIMFVALGWSSTAGVGANFFEVSYPGGSWSSLRTGFEISRSWSSTAASVASAPVHMLARFDESVPAERPDLVLWQVGTNAVLRGYEHSKSDALIRDGIRRMKAIGADVVLIDPQFAPKVIAKPEIEDMVDLISSAAKQENSTCFTALLLCGTGTTSMYAIRGIPFAGRAPYERLEL